MNEQQARTILNDIMSAYAELGPASAATAVAHHYDAARELLDAPNGMNYQNRMAAIAATMDGQEWNADTLDTIASVLRASGFDVREPGEAATTEPQHLASCVLVEGQWLCAADCPADDGRAHVYSVFATCDGTINEIWEVRSTKPLTRDELESLNDLHDREGVSVTFKSQETNDEDNRRITDIDVERGELLDTCDECGAGIPDRDGGSLENKHHAESCSLYDPDKE